MQTGSSRYKGGGINTRSPDSRNGSDRRNTDRRYVDPRHGDQRQQVSERLRTPDQNLQNQNATYNQHLQSNHTQHPSHAQQVRQVAAQVGVANENRMGQRIAESVGENLSYSKNVAKGAGITLWRPFVNIYTAIKRSYTHLSLKFEQANMFNTSLRNVVNSALIVVFVITAAILYRNGQIAEIKHTVIEKLGEWSGAAGVNVQEVKLFNRQHTSREEILEALNVKIGTPLLSFDVDAAKARIEKIGWVAQAEVQRILPDRLEISIIERDPFAIWQIEGNHVLVDRDGVLVADKVLRGYHLLPLIVGKGAATEALGLLSALEERPEIFEHVRALVRVGERRWDMDLNNGVRVLLPVEKPEAMLADLERMILDQDIFSRGINIIDFRLSDRVRFRMDDATAKVYFEAKQAAEKLKK